MDVHPPPDDTFLAIYWTLRDLRCALADRLPEFAHASPWDFIDDVPTYERIGYTQEQVEGLALSIEGTMEDVLVSRGWDALQDALSLHLDYP